MTGALQPDHAHRESATGSVGDHRLGTAFMRVLTNLRAVS